MNTDKKIYLKDVIKRKIGNRILLGVFIFVFLIMLQSFFEFRKEILILKSTAQDAASEISDFIVGQLLVNESDTAKLKIKRFNENNKTMQVEWIQSSEPDLINKLIWKLPASWSMVYSLQKFESKRYGYLRIHGTLFSDRVIVESIIEKIILLIIFIATMIFIFYPVTEKIPRRLIINPINDILAILLYKKHENITRSAIYEIAEIEEKIIKYIDIIEKKSIAEAAGETAAQVAHDMRSPLLAVDKFFHLIEKKLDESERIFGKRAVRRLDDIAWSLLAKYKNKEDVNNNESYIFLYSSLLELIAEKRMEYSKHNIEFDINIKPEDAFSLVFMNSVQLKRMLSNLLNNAVNAILPSSGFIQITLTRQVTDIIIQIKDNGKGLSSKRIQEILTQARSKKEKTNLGLPHAIHLLDEINGQLSMSSEENKGTIVTITLPSCLEPNWCLSEYYAVSDDHILIVDDCQSVHDVWDEAFKKIEPINFTYQHLSKPEEAIKFFQTLQHNKQLVIFCDYEFFDSEENGLSLLSQAPKNATKVLVTSHLYDSKIMQKAIDAGVNLLPKDLLPYFKLYKKSLPENNFGEVRLILIDNEKRNTESWEFFAKFKKMHIATYNDIDDFIKESMCFDKNVPVYIDLNLDREKTGIEYAKEIRELGFVKIYIATGVVDKEMNAKHYPWLTGIIEKRFPL